MNQTLKKKLEKMDREQLLRLFDDLCRADEVEKLLKLMLCPTKASIDRALKRFENSCYYLCDSFSARAFRTLEEAAEPLHASLKYADEKLFVYTVFQMHSVLDETGLLETDFYDMLTDYQADYTNILLEKRTLFSDQEYEMYKDIADKSMLDP